MIFVSHTHGYTNLILDSFQVSVGILLSSLLLFGFCFGFLEVYFYMLAGCRGVGTG